MLPIVLLYLAKPSQGVIHTLLQPPELRGLTHKQHKQLLLNHSSAGDSTSSHEAATVANLSLLRVLRFLRHSACQAVQVLEVLHLPPRKHTAHEESISLGGIMTDVVCACKHAGIANHQLLTAGLLFQLTAPLLGYLRSAGSCPNCLVQAVNSPRECLAF
eukprot:2959983-Amphidinium_carterae.1